MKILQKIIYFCVLFSLVAVGATNEIDDDDYPFDDGLRFTDAAAELLKKGASAVERINATVITINDSTLLGNGTNVTEISTTTTFKGINATSITIEDAAINATTIEGFTDLRGNGTNETEITTAMTTTTVEITETEETDSSTDTIEPDTTTAGSQIITTLVSPFFIYVCGAILLALLLGFCIGFLLARLCFKNNNNSGEYGTESGSSSS